ncbi:hypothetical protein CRG98_037239 [Punica granatum]|uniref:BHLH domain-containing protein n=1 Tax=Punica granatum TaxID=22663 RepID=A0A2I0IEF3_PUNGR|nr:hypothetical protein CRG98_037239 [Punica granatum]
MRKKGRVQLRRKRRSTEESKRARKSPARRKMEQLQRIIPGCDGQFAMDSTTLFHLIADYISFLELKASLLRTTISCLPLLSTKGDQPNEPPASCMQ